MRVILDIETNALHDPDKIWCVVAKDIDTNELHIATTDEAIVALVSKLTHVIGHNVLGFDLHWLRSILGLSYDGEVTDTLILSHLLKYSIEGGHSLEAWGVRLRHPKGKWEDFSKFSEDMLKYCINDVELTHKLYLRLKKTLLDREDHAFDKAIEVEHEMARICLGMHIDGFKFNLEGATTLRDKLAKDVAAIEASLQEAFPPKEEIVKTIIPRLTKHGTISKANLPRTWTDLSELVPGVPINVTRLVPFNPGSPTQVVERLNEAGWEPTDKTEGHLTALEGRRKSGTHDGGKQVQERRRLSGDELAKHKEKMTRLGWKVNETNLRTLPDTAPPAALNLVQFLLLNGRRRTLDEWIACCKSDGRVHARFNTIGTWTHRMSHNSPNLGNVAAPKSTKYKRADLELEALRLGKGMRELWTTTSHQWTMVGTDADQIQLRIFAHYVKDERLIKALCEGVKELGTDVHSLNAGILGLSRDGAKTFIYAFLLGAGDRKLGEIVGGSSRKGKDLKRKFIEAYPGLAVLRDTVIPGDVRRGFFEAFDGRLITCTSDHLMMAGYLQAGEAIVMKHANLLWRKEIDSTGIRYRQVNFVHDEWQTEVFGTLQDAERVGKAQADSIRITGESFGLSCPLAGQSKYGNNWYDTH